MSFRVMRKAFLGALTVLTALAVGCGGSKGTESVTNKPPLNEPDRVLYERAQREMKRGRYDIARLTLQTLINTYPDSEYLPKAKYGLGEASFREGGKEKMAQAAAEFEDYITFFPATENADDAQMMIALTHYKQMLAPDRDATEAKFALFELDKMIKDYPDSPLLEEAKARRRVVQERLAEASFKIGNLYLVRQQYLAAIRRYEEVVETYPDYTRMDEVLYSLGEAWRRAGTRAMKEAQAKLRDAQAKLKDKAPEAEKDAAKDAEKNDKPDKSDKTDKLVKNPENPLEACPCIEFYQRVVREYPRSDRVAESVHWLKELHMDIPEPSAAGPARTETKVEDRGLFGRVLGTVIDRGPINSNKTGAASVTLDGNKRPGNETTLSVDRK